MGLRADYALQQALPPLLRWRVGTGQFTQYHQRIQRLLRHDLLREPVFGHPDTVARKPAPLRVLGGDVIEHRYRNLTGLLPAGRGEGMTYDGKSIYYSLSDSATGRVIEVLYELFCSPAAARKKSRVQAEAAA